MDFPGGSEVKHLPAMQETWVRSLGQEDSLEKEMATHSSSLPGESHGWRGLVGYSPRGHKELNTTSLSLSLSLSDFCNEKGKLQKEESPKFSDSIHYNSM